MNIDEKFSNIWLPFSYYFKQEMLHEMLTLLPYKAWKPA